MFLIKMGLLHNQNPMFGAKSKKFGILGIHIYLFGLAWWSCCILFRSYFDVPSSLSMNYVSRGFGACSKFFLWVYAGFAYECIFDAVDCLDFDTATDYSQWEFACQEIAHSAGCPAETTIDDLSGCTHMHTVLVYECYEDAGCAADDSDIFYFVGADAAGAHTFDAPWLF